MGAFDQERIMRFKIPKWYNLQDTGPVDINIDLALQFTQARQVNLVQAAEMALQGWIKKRAKVIKTLILVVDTMISNEVE